MDRPDTFRRFVVESGKRNRPLLPLIPTVLAFFAAPIPLAMDLMAKPFQGIGWGGLIGTGALGLVFLFLLGVTIVALWVSRMPLRLSQDTTGQWMGQWILQIGRGSGATTIRLPTPTTAYYYVRRGSNVSSPVLVLVFANEQGQPTVVLEENLQPREYPPHGWPMGNGPTLALRSYSSTLFGKLDLPILKHHLDQIRR